MMRLTVNNALVQPALVFYWLRQSAVRRHIAANANSSNQTSINQVGLGSIPLAIPDSAEQVLILEVAGSIDFRLREETQSRDKLRILKSGLMDDLLTGRVRVSEAP